MKHVVVINQFALPRSEGGGTRHIDLFSRVADEWAPVIIAGARNHYSQRFYRTADRRFRLVRVPAQNGRPLSRLLGWCLFSGQAFLRTVGQPGLGLVVGSSPQPLGALAGLLAARLRRRPFVLEVRDLWPESMVSAGVMRRGSRSYWVFSRLERVLARQAARIICVTEGWETHFAGLGVAAEKLVVIPNGTEPADFCVAEERAALRHRYGIAGFTAVFAGAHGPKDGIDFIVEAARALPQVKFVLFGSGSQKNGARRRADDLALTNIDFREPVSKNELAKVLRACDVGLHTVAPLDVFEHGMSPNKLFDYLAAGLPVVSNAGTAVRRILTDGECGRVVEADGLAGGIEGVFRASPEQRTAWGERGRHIVASRYSRTSAGSALRTVLRQAASVPSDLHRAHADSGGHGG